MLQRRCELILEEMDDRLESELSYNDDLAVRAALAASANAGFQVGVAETMYEVSLAAKEAGVRFNLDVQYIEGEDVYAAEFD